MPIYTKGGDKGETGLPGKRRKSKADILFFVLGNLDQTNATIGLALSFYPKTEGKQLFELLQTVQSTLLGIGACLAAEQPSATRVLKELLEKTEILEQQIDAWDVQLPELKNFILPGGHPCAAHLHLARTVARQTERYYHQLQLQAGLEPIGIYLNRLSDFLFQSARYINFSTSTDEQIWR